MLGGRWQSAIPQSSDIPRGKLRIAYHGKIPSRCCHTLGIGVRCLDSCSYSLPNSIISTGLRLAQKRIFVEAKSLMVSQTVENQRVAGLSLMVDDLGSLMK